MFNNIIGNQGSCHFFAYIFFLNIFLFYLRSCNLRVTICLLYLQASHYVSSIGQWHEIKKEMPLVDFCLPLIGLKSTTWLFLGTMEARILRFNIYITEGKIRLKMEIWRANLKYLLHAHYPRLLTFLELAQTYVFIHSFIL